MVQAVLISQSDGSYLLEGDITLDTVTQLVKEGRASIKAFSGNQWQVDLSGVKSFSSAGVALLLDWLRYAQKKGKQMTIINPPASLRGITQVCGLDTIFSEVIY